jgi:hypothetical protein
MRLGIFLPCCTVSYFLLISYYTIDHSVFPLNLLFELRSAHQVPCATLNSLGETERQRNGLLTVPVLTITPHLSVKRLARAPFTTFTQPLWSWSWLITAQQRKQASQELRLLLYGPDTVGELSWTISLFHFTFLSSVNLWAKEAPRRIAKV